MNVTLRPLSHRDTYDKTRWNGGEHDGIRMEHAHLIHPAP